MVRRQPPVSIVLPIRNEAKHVEACILRLLDQDYPRSLTEIIIVDGDSDDGTQDVVREMQARLPDARLQLLHNPDRTVPQALNIGIRAARADIIIRVDGHTVPDPDYVSACVRALHASGAANVGGYLTGTGDTPFGTAVALATSHAFGMGNARYRAGGAPGDVDTVPFGTFRREVFRRVGLFDESMVRNQDYEMNVRIREAGERVYFDPSIRFTYTPRGTVRGLWRQYFQYGWWRVETIRRHPRSLRARHAAPPAFVGLLLALTVLAPWLPAAAWALALLLIVYLTMLSVAAARLSRGDGGTSPPTVVLAFLILHVAYGLGFLLNVLSNGRFPYRAGPARVPRLEARSEHATPSAGSTT
jgi:succinoglycan biosynthesis protein ExoA